MSAVYAGLRGIVEEPSGAQFRPILADLLRLQSLVEDMSVRLVATSRLVDGVKLGKDVRSGVPGQAPLLCAGTEMRPEYREALERHGVRAVYVDDDLSAGIEVPEAVTRRTQEEAEEKLAAAFDAGATAFAGGGPLPAGAVSDLRKVVSMIAADLANSGEAVLALADLRSNDEYTLQHSIDVTVLGLLLGRRVFNLYGWVNYRGGRSYDRIDERLATLGLGLLLHDVGKLIVPATVLNKDGPLDADEWEMIRQHPIAGIELLPGDAISPLAKSVVRSHHERWDGGGYPDGRAGTKISQFARIATVADVYDAITSVRPYRDARPPHVGYAAIVDGAGTAFDPEVVEAFKKVVAPYPIGTEITLGDGRRGIVASVPHNAPDQPVIRVTHGHDGAAVDPFEAPLSALGDVDEAEAA
jgi:HD-GYP domain-containing protein (c-di-GMP phosphodiesterase class II)